ncbi:MAG TPA: type II toxin-antitoxin system VapC family toxin [Candidatus Sulfotelmatobacter sp.]|nr:type II toxin-antitoxin system VapC family toxin [Candidatus Sulfotelmatobacter sp.]
MKQILVDSDVLIEVSRARDRFLLARWEELIRSEFPVFCSPVTIAEIWHGARPNERDALEALFGAISCVPIDSNIGRRAGEYLARYSKSHRIELGDALIAAAASIHNLELWTRNRRHYPMAELVFY